MDIISQLITTLKNAELAGHAAVTVRTTKMTAAVLRILEQGGYVTSVTPNEDGTISAGLTGERHAWKRISKPGRRLYANASHIPAVLGGRGMVVISTPNGVLSGKEAKKLGVGGELICEVY